MEGVWADVVVAIDLNVTSKADCAVLAKCSVCRDFCYQQSLDHHDVWVARAAISSRLITMMSGSPGLHTAAGVAAARSG